MARFRFLLGLLFFFSVWSRADWDVEKLSNLYLRYQVVLRVQMALYTGNIGGLSEGEQEWSGCNGWACAISRVASNLQRELLDMTKSADLGELSSLLLELDQELGVIRGHTTSAAKTPVWWERGKKQSEAWDKWIKRINAEVTRLKTQWNKAVADEFAPVLTAVAAGDQDAKAKVLEFIQSASQKLTDNKQSLKAEGDAASDALKAMKEQLSRLTAAVTASRATNEGLIKEREALESIVRAQEPHVAAIFAALKTKQATGLIKIDVNPQPAGIEHHALRALGGLLNRALIASPLNRRGMNYQIDAQILSAKETSALGFRKRLQLEVSVLVTLSDAFASVQSSWSHPRVIQFYRDGAPADEAEALVQLEEALSLNNESLAAELAALSTQNRALLMGNAGFLREACRSLLVAEEVNETR